MKRYIISIFLPFLLNLTACDEETDESSSTAVEQDNTVQLVHTYVAQEVTVLVEAAKQLQAAAPEGDVDGWTLPADQLSIDNQRNAWKQARIAYERIEGAIAVLFPELDRSTDERYDGFIEEQADPNLFDGMGVVGVHAIERILWADAHPPEVIAFESALPNYSPALFPANQVEAHAYKYALVQRLIDDAVLMQTSVNSLQRLDIAAAYGGVIGSMEEQMEKIDLAATGEDESRYAGHTLADMRANLEGGEAIYNAFVPWLNTLANGAELHGFVSHGFARIRQHYATIPGDSIPEVPLGWDSIAPNPEHLATPYGQLWAVLQTEADFNNPNSLVSAMKAVADALEIPI